LILHGTVKLVMTCKDSPPLLT